MLYTGKGDAGTTKVFGCDQTRISKASELPEALGALDELNSYLGVVKVAARKGHDEDVPGAQKNLSETLRAVQEALFIVQAEAAGADKHVGKEALQRVEEIIHAIEAEIPPLTGFSIAGGTELSAHLDTARTLARRAERRLIAVVDTGTRTLLPETKAYMNRLSSLFFALARLANHRAGIAEENPRY